MWTKDMLDQIRLSFHDTRPSSPEFPLLRVVPRVDLLLHEQMDTQRQIKLIDRISADGVLRNPPIVARLTGSDRYLLLDGANRVAALGYLDVPHVLVQVEDYDDRNLVLSHWNHVLRDLEAKTLIDMVKSIPGIFISEAPFSGKTSAEDRQHHLCTILFDESRAFGIFGGDEFSGGARLLRKISNLYYHGAARIDRVVHADLDELKRHHSNFGVLIIYRNLSKEEVREAAESGNRLPSGLTRFLLPRRVLGFNLRLDLLRSKRPLSEKQRLVEESIDQRLRDRKVRYYEESTLVFDD